MRRSYVNVKEKYKMNRKATLNRQEKNLSYRGEVIQRNNSEMSIMLKKARKYNCLAE
jgi:hypothetical protein